MIPCEIATRPDAHIHKWNITSRLELLLAKIAGYDVDLGTMTPPVATNLTEELLLEIAERVDNIVQQENTSAEHLVGNNESTAS